MKHAITIFIYLFCFFHILNSTGMTTELGRQHTISGETMGTFYTVKFISRKKESLSLWKTRVDLRLKEVNKRLSMYDTNSEISRFNREDIGKALLISPDFYTVLLTAQKIYKITGGAWDGTVKPLVDLWGFGTKKGPDRIPAQSEITLTLSGTGFDHIQLRNPNRIVKNKAITLDLGSIAKGYGVDTIADLFRSYGIQDVLVEIGGELYASGKNRKGKHWSVGISRPDKQHVNQNLFSVVQLKDHAIATSGNYRNFFEMDGKTFSHIINPKTGFPVDNTIVSASVIAEECTFADGLATALMVMSIHKGLELVNSLENTECLIIQKKGRQLIRHTSEKFLEFVVN